MPVTALVGFLIGVVLSYLSALQLQLFGADVFIVNILGLGIIRELGPVLVSVLVAGRSGSAMTAQLGVMRVTEEIDALRRWASRACAPGAAEGGGADAGDAAAGAVDLGDGAVRRHGVGVAAARPELRFLPECAARRGAGGQPLHRAAKGAVFGFLIALVACHFGLRVQPNTESLSPTPPPRWWLDHRGDPGRCRVRDRHPQIGLPLRPDDDSRPGPVVCLRGMSPASGATWVHEGLDLAIRAGEIVALVGGSGSGKTTLLRHLIGLTQPAAGEVRLFGEPAAPAGRAERSPASAAMACCSSRARCSRPSPCSRTSPFRCASWA
jgi:ABC-type multidrug transport system fused ATPase/permease subunit